MAVKKKTFEESLSRLGEIVRTMERGDAPVSYTHLYDVLEFDS